MEVEGKNEEKERRKNQFHFLKNKNIAQENSS